MASKWRVYWDNGTCASGTFPWEFDTEDDAQAFADNWVAGSCIEWGIDPESENAPSAEAYQPDDSE